MAQAQIGLIILSGARNPSNKQLKTCGDTLRKKLLYLNTFMGRHFSS